MLRRNASLVLEDPHQLSGRELFPETGPEDFVHPAWGRSTGQSDDPDSGSHALHERIRC